MLDKEEDPSKSKSGAPRIALCLAIVGVLYVIYAVGATTYAVQKNEIDPGPSGSYGAAISEADAESSQGPMNDDRKSQFITDLKQARVEAAKQDYDDAMRPARAREFNRELQAVWRSIPQEENQPSREFYAGLFRDEFMVESEHRGAMQGKQPGAPARQVWADKAFTVYAVPASDHLEITHHNSRLTLNILPCRKLVSGHFFKDCLTWKDGDRLLEIAYRERDLTEAEQADLQASKGRVARDLFNMGKDRVFN